MLLSKKKREIFKRQMDSCMQDMHLQRVDIVPLVSECWNEAFCNTTNNKRAIAERGWRPYNRNLLLHLIIQASMTEHMIKKERESLIFPHQRLAHLHRIQYEVRNGPMVEIKCIKTGYGDLDKMNLEGGATAQNVVSTLVTEVERQKARE